MSAAAGTIAPAAPSAIAVLVGLGQRARRATTVAELRFIIVNETVGLVPYRQALLWTEMDGLEAASGVTTIDHNAPFALWVDRLMKTIDVPTGKPLRLTTSTAPKASAEQWTEWLPANLVCFAILSPAGRRLGTLAFAREEPWGEGEIMFLGEASEMFALVYAWHRRESWRTKLYYALRKLPRWRLGAVILIIALGFLPVRLSVLGQAEIVPRDPAVIRSPLEGVVDRVLVQPNATVNEGDVLFDLDTTNIRGRLDVAEKAYQTSTAEYEQAAQQAFSDIKAKAQMGVLAGRVAERQVERSYLKSILARSTIKAPRGGIAVLDDPSEWAGRPVNVGERVLAIADEQDTEVEIWLPPQDLITLQPGAPITMFLNIDPLHTVHATLRYVSYESVLRADGSIAHRVRATISDGSHPQIGYKGTARLEGEEVSLAYWLFRRPLAVIRQTLGF